MSATDTPSALAETFVDGSRFAGTRDWAANRHDAVKWRPAPRPMRTAKRADGPKDIDAHPPRVSIGAEVVCSEPEVALGSTPPPEAGAPWTEEEFGRGGFRCTSQAAPVSTGGRFHGPRGELIPQAVEGSAAETKAAYRFFHNPQVKMKTLLRPHIESTIERLRAAGDLGRARHHHPELYGAPGRGRRSDQHHAGRRGGVDSAQHPGVHAAGHAARTAGRAMLGARAEEAGKGKPATPVRSQRRRAASGWSVTAPWPRCRSFVRRRG